MGIGYDYVLGAGGVYVQSESAHLTARVPVAPCDGAGPRSRGREGVAVPTAPSRRSLFELGLRWFQDDPDTERLFAVRWDGRSYRLVVAPAGRRRQRPSPTGPPQGVVAEFHSHGSSRAFFSATDDRDEQGFRIYGVAGRLDAPLPELSLRVGVYGHFAPVDWSAGVRRPGPGPPADWARSLRQRRSNNPTTREVKRKCPTTWTTRSCWTTPGSPWSAAAGPAASSPRVSAASSKGREATIVLVDHDRVEPHNLLRQNFYAEDMGKLQEPGPGRPAGQGLPASRRLLGLPLPG